MNFRNFQAASSRAGSFEVETSRAALPPAGRPFGGVSMPGNSFVRSSKSPLERSIAPRAEVDQNIIATWPAENDASASFQERFFMPQPRKIDFIVSSATRPAGPSKFALPFLTIGVSWLHRSACTNQLPVMFQPQKTGFCMPPARSVSQVATTSFQVVGSLVTPAFFISSML